MKIMKMMFETDLKSFNLKYAIEKALHERKYEKLISLKDSLREVLTYHTTKEDKFSEVSEYLRDIGVTKIMINYNREGGGFDFIGNIKHKEELENFWKNEIKLLRGYLHQSDLQAKEFEEKNNRTEEELQDIKKKLSDLLRKNEIDEKERDQLMIQLKNQTQELEELNEIHDKEIEAAAEVLEEMTEEQEWAEGEESVHLDLLSKCSELMKAVVVLKSRSESFQQEVLESEGDLDEYTFYNKNTRWSQGFASAVKPVAYGAKHLVEAVKG